MKKRSKTQTSMKNIWVIAISGEYSSFSEFKKYHVAGQGWSLLGDLSFMFRDDQNYDKYITKALEYGEGSTIPQNKKNALNNLLCKIQAGDILVAVQGPVPQGIAEVPPEHVYFYENRMKEYKQCLFPIHWIDWNKFSMDKFSVPNVQGVVPRTQGAFFDYIQANWDAWKAANGHEVQLPSCDAELNALQQDFPQKKVESERNFIAKIQYEKEMTKINDYADLLKTYKNIILQGAPGTGKTYSTAAVAVAVAGGTSSASTRDEVMKEYKSLMGAGQIAFVTFHQSMDYEDFVEGLKPVVYSNPVGTQGTGGSNNVAVSYEVKPGIFHAICKQAAGNPDKAYVLIIDEINRGNVSKIFGELITLLEADKRQGEANELSVKLPYSQTDFSVPSNLYIIGTMNTTDRSVGTIDYAIRRRFAFVTLKADGALLGTHYLQDPAGLTDAQNLFDAVKAYITNTKVDGDMDDLMVGHSYFMCKNGESLETKWKYEILPLLQEYYHDGLCKDAPTEEMCAFVKKVW